jgi:hypothetical protein
MERFTVQNNYGTLCVPWALFHIRQAIGPAFNTISPFLIAARIIAYFRTHKFRI